MKMEPDEKLEIINIVLASSDSIANTCKALGVARSTFHSWLKPYRKYGFEGLQPKKRTSRQWNKIPEPVRKLVVDVALEHTELSPRELATKITDEMEMFMSESSAQRILKERGLTRVVEHYFVEASNQFENKTIVPNQMWQTDFTQFKIIGMGNYYLSTVIDDFSRYIIHWEICTNMQAEDAQRTIATALTKVKLKKGQTPILLSDNGSGYIAKSFKKYLAEDVKMKKIYGSPGHPQTQGKIERWHKTMKSKVKLQNYYSIEELENAIEEFVQYYNYERYHEALKNCTPYQVYTGQDQKVLKKREMLKKQSINQRKLIELAYLEKIA
jgi:transposase InsO family protein